MDISQLRRRFTEILQEYEPRLARFPALLGDGSGTVAVPGRSGYVYVRIGNNETLGTAFNQHVMPRDDTPVIVGYSPEQPGLFQVLCLREVYSWGGQGNDQVPQIVPHHQIHELYNTLGGDDAVFVPLKQITDLATYPTDPASMYVTVMAGLFGWQESRKYFPGGTSADLTAYVPSDTGYSRAILISIDGETLDILATAGDQFLTVWPPEDFDDYIPVSPAGSIPSGIVILASTTTSIDWPEVKFDARLFVQPAGGSVTSDPYQAAMAASELDYRVTRVMFEAIGYANRLVGVIESERDFLSTYHMIDGG